LTFIEQKRKLLANFFRIFQRKKAMKSPALSIAIILAIGLAASAANAQINMERFRRDSQKKGLEGNADIDLTVMTGNTDFRLLGLGSRLNYNWKRAYTFLVLNGGLGWNQGDRFMDQTMAHLRHVLTLSTRFQNEWFIQFDNNRKRNLKERELIGIGVRAKLFTARMVKLRIGAAYMHEHERYTLAIGNRHPRELETHRLSSYITCEWGRENGLSLLNVTYFQPDLANWRDNRILTENALAMELSTHLALKITFTLRFDSKPPDGIKKLDTVSKSSLSVKF
jgi:putative salt-induced outer membrane protein YdiY